jgi:membrane fusion protein (multidrug efflux system)
VAVVESIPLDRTLPVVGTLFPKDEATVGAEVEGKVEKTMAEFGDRLSQGEEIALIDTESYAALANRAAAVVAQSTAASVSADQEFRRQDELRKRGISSPADYDKALADAEQAHAALKAAEANEVIAQLNLKRSHIRAPFDAAVADRVASAGDFVIVGAPLFRVVNDRVLKFIMQAPEENAAEVQKGQTVVFTVDAYPQEKFVGQIYLISPEVRPGSRGFNFGALVTNLNHRLKAGTYARGEVILERGIPTLVVPMEAVLVSSGIARVFVVENGQARAQGVRLGRVRDGRQVVLSGLQGGQHVIISGHARLRDGQTVEVRESNRTGSTASGP